MQPIKRLIAAGMILAAFSLHAQYTPFGIQLIQKPDAQSARAWLRFSDGIIAGSNIVVSVDFFGRVTINSSGGGGGGTNGGTVTTFSAGNLSPLFTTGVANPTTTPALSFTMSSQAQNLFFASPDGAPGTPVFRSILASDLPSLSLDELSDVVITAPSPGDGLAYSGTVWTNGPGGGGGAGTLTSVTNAGGVISLITSSNTPVPSFKSLSAGSGVTLTDQLSNIVVAASGGSGVIGYNSADNTIPLTVPVFDSNPAVTHPDLISLSTNWNGYSWWMTYTPFPPSTRELVHVAASLDGVNWETPSGGSLVVATTNDVPGSQFIGDPELCLTPDGIMHLWFLATGVSATNLDVYHMETSDGSTWSTPEMVIEDTGSTNTPLSQQVIVDNGNLRMFAKRRITTGNFDWSVIQWIGDLTGTNWTLIEDAVIAPSYTNGFWHFDVRKYGEQGYAMVWNKSWIGSSLAAGVSADGTNWTLAADILVETNIFTAEFDDFGWYKPSIIVQNGNPLTFSLYVGTANNWSGATVTNDWPYWRIAKLSTQLTEVQVAGGGGSGGGAAGIDLSMTNMPPYSEGTNFFIDFSWPAQVWQATNFALRFSTNWASGSTGRVANIFLPPTNITRRIYVYDAATNWQTAGLNTSTILAANQGAIIRASAFGQNESNVVVTYIAGRSVSTPGETFFNPLGIPGLTLWLDAGRGLWKDVAGTSPVTANGDVIQRWDDQSGNGNFVTNYTSNTTWNEFGGPNVTPSVAFPGSTIAANLFRSSSSNLLSAPVWIFFTSIRNVTNAAVGLFDSKRLGSVNGRIRFSTTTGTLQAVSPTILSAGQFLTPNFNLITVKFNGATSEIRTNGVVANTGDTGANDMYGFAIGAAGDGTGAGMNGKVVEVMVYTANLTAQNVDDVENYLRDKYSLY